LKDKLEVFSRMEPGFVSSREHAFLMAMIELRDPIDMDR